MTVRVRPLLHLAVAALAALTLGGCVSLLPKSKPVQLYRFGTAPPAEALARPQAVSVLRAGGVFQRESAGDRILTITGSRAAYIAGARWVAPAEVLFDEALSWAFDSVPGPARLVARGEPGRADYALRLDVRNFETHYDARHDPVVVVRVRAALSGPAPRFAVPAEQLFEARVPAQQNRVSAIVAAYDKATAQVLNQVATWANAQLG
jgi:cholesterol transport system auxiliary component